MKRNLIIGLFLFLGLLGLPAQSFTGNIETYLNSLVDILPGKDGNNFVPPAGDNLIHWEQMTGSLLTGSLEGARVHADLLNYKITDFEDNTTVLPVRYYVVEEKTPQDRYWGTYVFHRNPLRPGLVLQAPHPVYDLKTGAQAIFCFKRLGAAALFFSGTHRCNHSESSVCSGSTTVCSGFYEPYRISDNAHNTNSAFQVSTQVFFDRSEDTAVFVQLHGFAKLSGDPYLIISNGTRITPDQDPIVVLQSELLQEDDQLSFKVIHLDPDWNRLTALSNTQGRYINGSSDPCREDATASNGRFIHIEQERTRLRDDSTGWYKMYKALERTFPARDTITGLDGSGLTPSILLYPNPAKGILSISVGRPFHYSLYTVSGLLIMESRSDEGTAKVDLDAFAPGVYIVAIQEYGSMWWRKVLVQ